MAISCEALQGYLFADYTEAPGACPARPPWTETNAPAPAERW